MNPQNIQAMVQMQQAMQQLQSSGIMPGFGDLAGAGAGASCLLPAQLDALRLVFAVNFVGAGPVIAQLITPFIWAVGRCQGVVGAQGPEARARVPMQQRLTWGRSWPCWAVGEASGAAWARLNLLPTRRRPLPRSSRSLRWVTAA